MKFEEKEYTEVRSDRDFMEGVYTKIEEMQLVEREREIIRRNMIRRLKYKAALFVVIILSNIPFVLKLPVLLNQNSFIFIWGSVLMVSGAVYEYFNDRYLRSDYNADIN